MAGNPRIQGLLIPGQGSVRVSAYADDVSVFVKSTESVAEVIKDFHRYARLSEKKLNVAKSVVLPKGNKGVEFSHNFCVV